MTRKPTDAHLDPTALWQKDDLDMQRAKRDAVLVDLDRAGSVTR